MYWKIGLFLISLALTITGIILLHPTGDMTERTVGTCMILLAGIVITWIPFLVFLEKEHQ